VTACPSCVPISAIVVIGDDIGDDIKLNSFTAEDAEIAEKRLLYFFAFLGVLGVLGGESLFSA